jgi:hypothetical protein
MRLAYAVEVSLRPYLPLGLVKERITKDMRKFEGHTRHLRRMGGEGGGGVVVGRRPSLGGAVGEGRLTGPEKFPCK